MKNKKPNWTKTELQVYIMLLCANADKKETEEELEMIQNKIPKKTFLKMHKKFHKHSKKKRLNKIESSIDNHNYTEMELAAFRREMYKIFFSDCSFSMMEERLDMTLDNILY
ncbi:hypothetical protein DFQ10_103249 [Winogradskyella eximia]|jgi:hypothetical protein|uniref:Tellurite resistance protein TerB n=1 Tax=Winogradskyella eximia TaxID=262006 RepID=A0A3D9H528_9FLAO|nr:hypothetical protein [Winogradskyella eximia]RED44562.1 hypothetical protein DFQ10_103249 [Winogradskyella eximia]